MVESNFWPWHVDIFGQRTAISSCSNDCCTMLRVSWNRVMHSGPMKPAQLSQRVIAHQQRKHFSHRSFQTCFVVFFPGNFIFDHSFTSKKPCLQRYPQDILSLSSWKACHVRLASFHKEVVDANTLQQCLKELQVQLVRNPQLSHALKLCLMAGWGDWLTWFNMENPSKMDDLGVPPLIEPPGWKMLGNHPPVIKHGLLEDPPFSPMIVPLNHEWWVDFKSPRLITRWYFFTFSNWRLEYHKVNWMKSRLVLWS